MHNKNALRIIIPKDGKRATQFDPIGKVSRPLPRGPQVTSNIDWAQVEHELAELPPFASQSPSSTLERSEPSRPTERICFVNFLQLAIKNLTPMIKDTGREIELELTKPPNTLHLGKDIHEALCSLLETSISMGAGPIRVCGRAVQMSANRACVVIEVLNDAIDVPDKVRRKLTKAVSAQSGETSFMTALHGSGVRIRIPICTADAPSIPRLSAGFRAPSAALDV